MMKFRKKPVVIDAVQFDGVCEIPGVVISPVLEPTEYNPRGVYGQIRTLEGVMTCVPGDWIITGVKGEVYPCKPDIFEATYEAVIAEVARLQKDAASRDEIIAHTRGVIGRSREALVDGGAWGHESLEDAAKRLTAELAHLRAERLAEDVVIAAACAHVDEVRRRTDPGRSNLGELNAAIVTAVDALRAARAGDGGG